MLTTKIAIVNAMATDPSSLANLLSSSWNDITVDRSLNPVVLAPNAVIAPVATTKPVNEPLMDNIAHEGR